MAIEGEVEVVMPPLPAHTISPNYPPDLPLPPPPASQNDTVQLVRSASYTVLPQISESQRDGIKRTFSENVLSIPSHETAPVSNSLQTANAELFRRASRKTRRRMTALSNPLEEQQPESEKRIVADDGDRTKSMSRTVSGTLKSFARKSWMPTRSTSPLRKDDPSFEGKSVESKKTRSPKKRLSYSGKPITIPQAVAVRQASRSPRPDDQNGEYFTTQRRASPSPAPRARSLRDLGSRNNSATSFHQLSRQSSSVSLKSRSSAEGMYLGVPGARLPPMPQSTSTDRLSAISSESTRKKDPLWNAFRTIDGEFSAFQSKTSLQKAKTVRSILLPFLSRHSEPVTSQSLRAEDLDRRIHILNKWWAGLLELLNGRSNHSISGTDRPTFLEATTEIMLRPEWRVPPLPRPPHDFLKRRYSSSNARISYSTDWEESDFLIDSIHQNIRNMFVQNLLSQMAFVVDKLSLRSAPASLVNFSGKTCAYAFFFCPGVADILVRLWHIPPGMLRRIFSEYGALHTGKGKSTPFELATKFPPPIRSLCFSSQAALGRHIQPKAQRPPGSETIRWYGPWVNRWIGRDSDLFFVFVKYYHILVCQFQRTTLTAEERVCIPGLVPVHAQWLVVLESTLYRHVSHFTTDPYQTGDGIEAMAPLPMSIPNATRTIAENRLVMLLKDLSGEASTVDLNVSELVIFSFEALMRAATRRISMFNNDACFILCDLLEEICPVMSKYEQINSQPILEWSFWTNVLQLMMRAHTTMTQIRVIALLYSIWIPLTLNDQRRREIILNWILESTFFSTFFCHWSSMVRHYFLRLLCWRVARCDGELTQLDEEILQTIMTRLNTFWAYHQYLLAEADMRGISVPVSNACSPAPGRALVIIRTDTIISPQFSTFDKILTSNQGTPYRSHSSTLNAMPEADQLPIGTKKRWSILRSMNPFASGSVNPRPGEVTPPTSPDGIVNRILSNGSAPNSLPSSRPTTPPYQPLSFKFSLEYTSERANVARKLLPPLPPSLPAHSQKVLDDLQASASDDDNETAISTEVKPLKPHGEDLKFAKYSGRALSSWSQVVSECQNFYSRRRHEGCPKDSLVETPAMAVEAFRLFG